MKPSHALAALLLAGAGIYAVVTRPRPPQKPPVVLGMLRDNSGSVFARTDCETYPTLVKNELEGIEYGKGSSVILLSLGDAASSYESRKQAEIPLPPPGAAGMFGGDADDNIRRRCAEIKAVKTSSIFRGVQLSLDHLRGLKMRSKLVVQTDLDESVARQIVGLAAVRPLLDNTGVEVTMCGYAVTLAWQGPRGEVTAGLINRWHRSFTHQELVTFKPYCRGGEKQEEPQR